MMGWRQDLRGAWRLLRLRPGFSALVVLTLALGLGSSSAVFALLDTVWLRPLAYPAPDRLLAVREIDPRGRHNSVSPANFLDWEEMGRDAVRLSAYASGRRDLTGAGEPARLDVVGASWRFFDILGVPLAYGRGFGEADDQHGAARVVIVSHGLFLGRFGGDPGLVGRTIVLDDEPHEVVGVASAEFAFPSRDVDVWTPIAFEPDERQERSAYYLRVVGRLVDGVSLASARARMATVASALSAAHPDSNADSGVALIPLQSALTAASRPALLALGGAVLLLLGVACANVATLFVARSRSRSSEFAVRVALGAGRARLLRQTTLEALVLTGLGSLVGLGLAAASFRSFSALEALGVASAGRIALDWRVAGFAVVTALLVGVLFGVLPVATVRLQLAPRPRTNRGGAPSRGFHSLLGATQAALAIVSVLAAGVLANSFVRLTRVDPGFNSAGVATFNIAPTSARYAERDARRAYYDRLLDDVSALPGVASAGITNFLPMTFGGGTLSIGAEGRPEIEERFDTEGVYIAYRVVDPGFFSTLEIPLRRGRMLDRVDIARNPQVAWIDETTARHFFPDSDPIGQRIKLFSASADLEWMEIVGIVGATRHFELGRDPHPTLYVPYLQSHGRWAAPRTLVVRSHQDLAALVPAIRAVVSAIDPTLPVSDIRTFDAILAESIAPQRVIAVSVAALGAVALALAMIGLYGLAAYFVSGRTAEFGVRIALGAQARDIVALVLRWGVTIAVAGLAAGSLVWAGVGRYTAALLYGVEPADPVTWAGVALTLLATSIAACLVPAYRAARVDPTAALRTD